MVFDRLLEFCSTAYKDTPQEDIRACLPNGLSQTPEAFEPYEHSLERLDAQSWEHVKQKLIRRTRKDFVLGWAQFYDILAEVSGFCHFLDSGYTEVHFISETNNFRTPDVQAIASDGIICLLESKRISSSDCERKYILENTRRLGTNETLVVRDVAQGMPQALKNKIESTVANAKEQLLEHLPQETSAKRIVFLTIQLDVHMKLDMNNRTEIINFIHRLIREESEVEIVINSLSLI